MVRRSLEGALKLKLKPKLRLVMSELLLASRRQDATRQAIV